MYIARPLGFNSLLWWWNHVYSTLFSFLQAINMFISIIVIQFCDGWWCGCSYRRIPYVTGIEWHASRFDYALLLPPLRATSAMKRTSVRYTLIKEKKKRRTREMIILSVYGARARTTVSATLLSHQHIGIYNDARIYVCVSLCWWQWDKLKRASKQTKKTSERTKRRMTFRHLCLFKIIRPLVTVVIVSLEEFIMFLFASLKIIFLFGIFYAWIILFVRCFNWSYSYPHLLTIFYFRLTMSLSFSLVFFW